MAHKSIADQILMDLKKEKEETFKANKDDCLEFMQKLFDLSLSNLVKLEADQQYSFPDNFSYNPLISKETFISVTTSLGFKIIPSDTIADAFYVPEHEKGKKMTPAQKMLYNHVIALNKKTKECNQSVQAEISRVWESIKKREFTSKDNNDGTFTLSIPLTLNSYEGICDEKFIEIRDDKLLSFLSARAFPNAYIEFCILYITLGIED